MSFIFGQSLARREGDFFQASRQQLLAHRGEVGARLQRHAEFHAKRGRRVSVGRAHELHILHVLASSPIDDRGNAIGDVSVGREFEFIERRKEMVVA